MHSIVESQPKMASTTCYNMALSMSTSKMCTLHSAPFLLLPTHQAVAVFEEAKNQIPEILNHSQQKIEIIFRI